MAVIFSNIITRPLHRLVEETKKIKNLYLEGDYEPSSNIKEIYAVEDGVMDMKMGLRSFEKYVPKSLVKSLIKEGIEAERGGEKRCLTLLFSDIENFTRIAESTSPNELFPHLSDYLDVVIEEIKKYNGTIDKFIGDSIMVFWNAPTDDPHHQLHAVKAAMDINDRLEDLKMTWEIEYKPLLNTRIGIHTGEVIVGNVGTDFRLNYTVLGDNVNLASRIESINKFYSTSILITEATTEGLNESIACRFIDRVIVKGRTQPISLYQPFRMEQITERIQKVIFLSKEAYESYKNREWNEAETLYRKILNAFPGDPVARLFIDRIQKLKASPPDDDWNGVHEFFNK